MADQDGPKISDWPDQTYLLLPIFKIVSVIAHLFLFNLYEIDHCPPGRFVSQLTDSC